MKVEKKNPIILECIFVVEILGSCIAISFLSKMFQLYEAIICTYIYNQWWSKFVSPYKLLSFELVHYKGKLKRFCHQQYSLYILWIFDRVYRK